MKIASFLILCLIWGSTWIAIKLSLQGISPLLGAGIRFLIAIVVLFLFILLKKISFHISKRDFLLVCLTGFFTYSLDYGLIFWGEQFLSAGVTSIFFASFVLFTSIGANFIFKNEGFSWKKFTGLWIGFIGITVVFLDQLVQTHFDSSIALASGAIVLGAAAGGISVVMVKKYLSRINPFILCFYQLLIGTFFLILSGLILEDIGAAHFSYPVLAALIYMGIVGSAFAFVLYYWLLQSMSAITLSLIIYVTPVVALVGDSLFFKELISFRSLWGMGIIFFGIWLTQQNRKIKSGE